jgi:hypothetical protein
MRERPDNRMRYFALLDCTEQAKAISRLDAAGMSHTGIAAATMLSIEQIRKILGEQRVLEESAA